jgi:DNA repair exonuclease SbcCD nuclease subunit
MKILHVSDTHLGYSAYNKVTLDGINQREIDTYDAFKQFIDYAVKTKPDLIIHAGDLFDSVRPNNRAITVAIDQFLRISKEKIPFIIISGNHEHPKLMETGHIFSIFDHIDNVYPIYKAKYEKIPLKIKNENIMIHAIPQCELKTQFEDEIKKLKTDKTSKYNIFVSHGAVSGIRVFSMNEFNELIIPAKALSKDFDYIALGHYHKFTKLADNAFYSGSTERFTFIDATDEKGFVELDFKNGKLNTKLIGIEIREMFDSKPIKCANLRLEEVMNKIKQTFKDIKPKEKTFRITLDDIPTHVYRGIDFREIRKLGSEAIHYEIKANVIKDGESKKASSSKINALTNEFKQFIEGQDLKEKDTILDLGIGYIEKIEAREEGK